MPATTLKCPQCSSDLPDDCRGLYPLHGVHADYLCPHCDTVLAWQRPMRPVHQWLILLSVLPLAGIVFRFAVPLIWRLVIGLPPNDFSEWWGLAAFVLPFLMVLVVRVQRSREPWILLVKKDPMKEIWEMETAELKLRSKPGSKW